MDGLFAQHILNWMVLGSIYTLIAIGFSLLFGLLNVIHFSHGDVSMIAPFVALGALQILIGSAGGANIGWLLAALAVAILATGMIGVVADKLVIRRFRNSPAMMALVATVALGTVLRELVRGFYPQGSNPKAFPGMVSGAVELGGVRLSIQPLLIVGVTIAVIFGMHLLMNRTPIGLRIRAVAEDRDTARLMGIHPDRIFAFTFFIASATGALGALFFASHSGVVRFDFGVQLGLIGFSAAVIGGLGSTNGAIIGAMAIAAIETLVQVFVPDGAAYRLAFVFLLVIGMLCIRPGGILGKVVQEKV